MSLAAATDKYNEIEGDGIFNYVRIFFAVLIISGFLALTAIRLFQGDVTHSSDVSPLVRVSQQARVSPLEVAIVEAASRPFATDPITPYGEQLREAVVLESHVTPPVSGRSEKTDSGKDSTPVAISKPKPESPVAESHAGKIRTIGRTVHPGSRTVKRHAADNKVLLARVETPVASPVAPKAVQAVPITEAVEKTMHEGGPVTDAAALKSIENIPVASAVPAQVNTGLSIAGKPVENTSVASIAPSPVNTVSSVTNKPEAGMAPAENKNSVSFAPSFHSPMVSPDPADTEVKAEPADASRDTAASGVSKEGKAAKEDNKEEKKKGLSAITVIEWTLKIVGLALMFLK